FARKPCNGLEISDEIVALLLILKVHLIRLGRVEDVPQSTGLVLLRQLIREQCGPEKLRKRSDMSDITRAPLHIPLPKNILTRLVIVDYVRDRPAGHPDSRELFLSQLVVYLAS